VRKFHFFFLAIGKAAYVLSLHQRLGFCPDGTRKPTTVRPTEALGRDRFLQIRAQPNLLRRAGLVCGSCSDTRVCSV
jgi:hypothetical protein